MNLYGILAVSPTNILLQQVTVNVCFVNVVVANVQLVRETFVNLVKFEVAANPVVCVFATGPNALYFCHVASFAYGHHLVVPHRVVKVGQSPSQSLCTAANLGSIDFFKVGFDVSILLLFFSLGLSVIAHTIVKSVVPYHVLDGSLVHGNVVEVVCANPKFLFFAGFCYVNQRNVLDGNCGAVLTATEIEVNHEVVNTGLTLEINVNSSTLIFLSFYGSVNCHFFVCQFDSIVVIVGKFQDECLERLVSLECSLEVIGAALFDFDGSLELQTFHPHILGNRAGKHEGVFVTFLSFIKLRPGVSGVVAGR